MTCPGFLALSACYVRTLLPARAYTGQLVASDMEENWLELREC